MILFLDDQAARRARFLREYPMATRASTAAVAIHFLTQACNNGGMQPIICLDHDLGGTGDCEPCGANCGCAVVEHICHLVRCEFRAPRLVVLHSYNAPAAQRMQARLHEAGVNAVLAPFNATRFWAEIAEILNA